MNRCPISYEKINSGFYSRKGLNRLASGLKNLKPLPFSDKELILESQKRMTKMSIQGVQPKLSVRLSVKKESFEIVDQHGIYILKPNPSHLEQVPENEDLTMRLAGISGINVPFHGLVYNKDGDLVYLIRRFDRAGKSKKVHVEDFAQVGGMSRETKYDYSMEKVAKLIDRYCTFPVVEKMKLFRLTIFSYLTGNEDMHLKNFSLIHNGGKIELSPAYDLLNSTIVLSNPKEEMALPIRGKKSNFTYNILFNYFGNERLGMNNKVLKKIEEEFREHYSQWLDVIKISFLKEELQEKYVRVLDHRRKKLGWD